MRASHARPVDSHPWSTGPIPAPSANPAAIAPVTYLLATVTASGTESPIASRDAIADASVHPVPCVCRVSCRGARSQGS